MIQGKAGEGFVLRLKHFRRKNENLADFFDFLAVIDITQQLFGLTTWPRVLVKKTRKADLPVCIITI